MPFISRLVSFWRNVFRRSQVEQDLDDELRACVDEIAGRNLREGMSTEDARAAAIHELGGIDGLKQKIRSQHIGRLSLRRVAAFAGVAMLFFVAGAGTVAGFVRWGDPEWAMRFGIVRRETSTSNPTLKSLVSYTNARTEVRLSSSVEGLISEKETGKPLSNVEVQLRPVPQLSMRTTTDEWGQFSFLKPLPGNYTLVVGSKSAEFGVATRAGNHVLTVPTEVAFNLSVRPKQGKPVSERYPLQYALGMPKSWMNIPLTRPVRKLLRIINYSEGQIEIGIPTDSKP